MSPRPHLWPCMRRRAGALALAASGLLLAGCAGGAPPTPAVAATPTDPTPAVAPEIARATFDSAWRRVASTYYDTTFRGVDWAGVRAELAPRAAAAATMGELRDVVQTMLDRLGDSHLVIIPGEAVFGEQSAEVKSSGPGWSGTELRLVDGAVLVARVARGSPAALAGLRPGDAVLQVGRIEIAPRLARLAALDDRARAEAALVLVGGLEGQLQGSVGDTVRLRRRGVTDAPDEVALVLARAPGEVVQFGNLPPMVVRVDTMHLESSRGCVGYARLSVWMPAAMAPLEQAVEQYGHCAGFVLDLRGNPGGVGGLVMRVGGFFLDSAHSLGTMRTRGSTLRFVAAPRRVGAGGAPAAPFAGRLAILTDEFSMSTSEIAAAGLQAIGRARVFGTATPGKALPSGMVRLPSGDVLLHAYAEFLTPTGERLEGAGVRPDTPVPLTADALRAGRDAALQAAVAWILDADAAAPGR